jgi:hypothetical protein
MSPARSAERKSSSQRSNVRCATGERRNATTPVFSCGNVAGSVSLSYAWKRAPERPGAWAAARSKRSSRWNRCVTSPATNASVSTKTFRSYGAARKPAILSPNECCGRSRTTTAADVPSAANAASSSVKTVTGHAGLLCARNRTASAASRRQRSPVATRNTPRDMVG